MLPWHSRRSSIKSMNHLLLAVACSKQRTLKSELIIVELRTPAMPVGVGGGKERGGFHLNLRT